MGLMGSTVARKKAPDEAIPNLYVWRGRNGDGDAIQGEITAREWSSVAALLTRQGVTHIKIHRKRMRWRNEAITEKDIAIFTRQLATMIKSGIPLMTCFEVIMQGHPNIRMRRLLIKIRNDLASGESIARTFARHPKYFNDLYCDMLHVGEQAGILEDILGRLAVFREKTLAVKARVRQALFYPTAVIVVAFVVTTLIMIFVVPTFKSLFESFGADLPTPTQIVINLSEFLLSYWWAIFGVLGGGGWAMLHWWRHSAPLRRRGERFLMGVPGLGEIFQKAAIARWMRTFATMYGAGIPINEMLNAVGRSSGSSVYAEATEAIKNHIETGNKIAFALGRCDLFPPMALQLFEIGEESGTIGTMSSKVAEYYEREVDHAVDGLSSLMEPAIMAVLGVLVGGLVIALYLPIFKMGQVV